MVKHYIGGKLVEGNGKLVQVTCPANDEVLEEYASASAEQVEQALESAEKAFKTWSKLSINEREKLVKAYINALLEEKDTFVDLTARENGQNYVEAESQVVNNFRDLAWYFEEAKREYNVGLTDPRVGKGDQYHIVEKYPLGVIVGHIAWNFPIGGACKKIGPALAAGCTCVIKPSSQTPLATHYMGVIAEKIGFPAGVINIVSGPSSVVGKALNESKIPRMIGLIGSCETGREVIHQSATSIKRYSMELGGNSPCILMPDADLDVATTWIVNRKMGACGQGCTNVNRVYVHKSIHEKTVGLLLEKLKEVQIGWGKEKGKVLGPQVVKEHRDYVLELIEDAVANGAELLYGGRIPEGLEKGNFIMPTLLDHANDEMRICKEEIFGPVVVVYEFEDLDDVINRSNNTHYGLAAYLYSHDSRVIAKCSEELEFGMVNVNNPNCAGTNMPHVGIKESGVGCDSSKWSLDQYYCTRRISIRP